LYRGVLHSSKTPKIKSNGGLDIGDVKAKRTKNILEVIKIFIERMRVETLELSRRTMGKKWNSINSQFPSIVDMSKSKNDLEECNIFPKDYNEYNATKRLI
jgi:hypothetical protein